MYLSASCVGPFDCAQGRLFAAKSAAQDDNTLDYSKSGTARDINGAVFFPFEKAALQKEAS
jgi:hypothetical protein